MILPFIKRRILRWLYDFVLNATSVFHYGKSFSTVCPD